MKRLYPESFISLPCVPSSLLAKQGAYRREIRLLLDWFVDAVEALLAKAKPRTGTGFAAKLAVLQQKFEELSACNEQAEQKRETAKEITQYNGISELTPEVMKALVKRVVIYPDKHIRIEWNFSDNMIPFTRKVNWTWKMLSIMTITRVRLANDSVASKVDKDVTKCLISK